MNPRRQLRAIRAAFLLLAIALCTSRAAFPEVKTMHASGTFQVDVKPASASDIGQQAGLGRMTLSKTWSGGMQGASQGEMTTTAVGSAMVYVALEKFTGSVDGRSGSFYFVHTASMLTTDPASAVMDVTIAPNTGTGQLAGISGKLTITIDKSGHSYNLQYTLPQAQ